MISQIFQLLSGVVVSQGKDTIKGVMRHLGLCLREGNGRIFAFSSLKRVHDPNLDNPTSSDPKPELLCAAAPSDVRQQAAESLIRVQSLGLPIRSVDKL